jgi:hypothetical protein
MNEPNMRKPIIEKCVGCKKITEDNCCEVYINPEVKWAVGGCGISTHISKLPPDVIAKKINPLKASKRLKKKKG